MQWTPFFQTCKNKQKYPWVQLAGHQGNFKAGSEPGTVMKKLTPKEEICFKELMQDVMRPYVPEFKGVVNGDDEEVECETAEEIARQNLIRPENSISSSISSTSRSSVRLQQAMLRDGLQNRRPDLSRGGAAESQRETETQKGLRAN